MDYQSNNNSNTFVKKKLPTSSNEPCSKIKVSIA